MKVPKWREKTERDRFFEMIRMYKVSKPIKRKKKKDALKLNGDGKVQKTLA